MNNVMNGVCSVETKESERHVRLTLVTNTFFQNGNGPIKILGYEILVFVWFNL